MRGWANQVPRSSCWWYNGQPGVRWGYSPRDPSLISAPDLDGETKTVNLKQDCQLETDLHGQRRRAEGHLYRETDQLENS